MEIIDKKFRTLSMIHGRCLSKHYLSTLRRLRKPDFENNIKNNVKVDMDFVSMLSVKESKVSENDLHPTKWAGQWHKIEDILSRNLLVSFCKKNRLAISGSKKQLADRLRKYFKAESGDSIIHQGLLATSF